MTDKAGSDEHFRPLNPTVAGEFRLSPFAWDGADGGVTARIRSEWSSSNQCSRHREVLLARLRLGHTYLTHKYLLSPDKIVPHCDTCSVRLTVRHIFLDCPKFQRFRRSIMKFVSSLQLPLSLSVLLGDDHPILLKLVFKFLDDAELSDLIC